MIKEQAQMLQEDFVKLCNEHGMKGSFGYFIDRADNTMLAYNKTSDNEMMHMIANLIVRIAQKHETSVDDVLKALRDGIKDLPKQN